MSQMFNKYLDEYVDIPNNQLCFLPRRKEFKDILALDADNEHTFQLPYEFSEMCELEIRYIQGTEVKLVKTFDMSRFIPENTWDEQDQELTEDIDESINPNEGIKMYTYFDGSAKLFELDKKTIFDQIEFLSQDASSGDLAYCVLYYSISPEETKLFNDYNKEVYVQLKMLVNIKQDNLVRAKTDFSRLFKLKLTSNIFDVKVVEEVK